MVRKITKSRFIKDSEKIIEKLLADNTPLDESKKNERIEKAKNDILYFANTYLPHYADCTQFPDFYHYINNEYSSSNSITIPFCYAAPRGFAKSVYFLFRVIHSICYKTNNFIIYVSANDDLAKDFVDFVRLEISDNERIKKDFNISFQIGKKSSFLANGVRVFSRSKGQMVRGFRFRNHRPDLVIIDDIEKDADAESPAIVKKILSVITKGLYPSLKPGGKLFIFGTIIRKRSVLGTILYSDDKPYSSWNRKIFNAIEVDENGDERSLWQERFPLENLYRIRDIIGTNSFNSEYQNRPTDDESSMFQESWIKCYNNEDINKERLIKTMFIDPSIKNTKKADYKAIITVGFDKASMNYYVLSAWIKKTTINNMLRAVFRLYEKYNHELIGFESNGFQELLKPLFEELEKEYKINLPLKLIPHYQSKEIRIAKLSPLMERGKIFFKNIYDKSELKKELAQDDFIDDTKILIDELLYYPSSIVNDDGPDALAEAINMANNFSSKPFTFLGSSNKSDTDKLFGFSK